MNEITYLLYQKCHLKLFLLVLVTEVIFQAPLCIAKHVFSQTGEPDCKVNTPSSSRNCIKKYCYTIMLNNPALICHELLHSAPSADSAGSVRRKRCLFLHRQQGDGGILSLICSHPAASLGQPVKDGKCAPCQWMWTFCMELLTQ